MSQVVTERKIRKNKLSCVKPTSRKKLPDYTKVHQEMLIICVHCNSGYGCIFDVYCANSREGGNNDDLTLEQNSYQNDCYRTESGLFLVFPITCSLVMIFWNIYIRKVLKLLIL